MVTFGYEKMRAFSTPGSFPKPHIVDLLKFGAVVGLLFGLVIFRLGTFVAPGTENSCYTNYARSIVDDHDLNILDKIDRSSAWIVTRTFNYPDMHDQGAPVLWSPFLLAAKALHLAPLKAGVRSEPYYHVVNFLLSILFVSFALLLLSEWIKTKFGDRIRPEALFPVVFGTGFFFYSFLEFNCSDITLFFYAAFFLVVSSTVDRSFGRWDYLFLGILYGFGRAIKIHFLLQLLPLLFFYWKANRGLKPKKHAIFALCFSLGALLILLPVAYNNYLKYGFFFFGQGYIQEYNPRILFDRSWDDFLTYFGPVGFFSHTPVFFFSFLGFLYLAWDWVRRPLKMKTIDQLAVVLYLGIIAKLILIAFAMKPEQEFGERRFIIDTFAHCLVLNSVFSRIKARSWKYRALVSTLVLSAAWTMVNLVWSLHVIDVHSDQLFAFYPRIAPMLRVIKGYLGFAKEALAHPLDAVVSNGRYFILLAFPAWVLLNLKALVKGALKRKRVFRPVALVVLFLLLGVTSLNHFNNHRNAALLKASGDYRNVVVGNGPDIFTYDNVATDVVPVMEYYRRVRNRRAFEQKKKYFLKFIAAAKAEILQDNAGFTKAADSGQIPRIGLTNDASATEVMDFNGADRWNIDSGEEAPIGDSLATFKLNVRFHHEEHKLSCEAAALTMVLDYYGLSVSESEILSRMPFDRTPRKNGVWGDPDLGFVGDVDGVMGVTGYGIHWRALARLASRWKKAHVIEHGTVAFLVEQLNHQRPVITWGYGDSGAPLTWKTKTGRTVHALDGEHARVVYGYAGDRASPSGFFVMDPFLGPTFWPRDQFLRNWASFGFKGVVLDR